MWEKHEEIKQEKDEIKEELSDKRNLQWVEKKRKRNNSVITGILVNSKDSNNLKQTVTNFSKQNLQVKIHVKSEYKLAETACSVVLLFYFFELFAHGNNNFN